MTSDYFLKSLLDRFYRDYNFKDRLRHDPVEFLHRYSSSEDIEVAGFIASSFAYGKVELFRPVIEKILLPGGRHPARFFTDFNFKKESKYFNGITYRFNKEEDVLCLIYMLSMALKQWGSLRRLFYQFYQQEHKNVDVALNSFINYFLSVDTSPMYGKNMKPAGVIQFFPMPVKGSACKRMNLFLRWMVRNRDIDLGIWDRIPPSKLIIPLDTHIAKISKCLGLTKRTASDLKTALEITESLKKYDPEDPLKYDFALCHQGISGLCRGRKSINTCQSCAILRR